MAMAGPEGMARMFELEWVLEVVGLGPVVVSTGVVAVEYGLVEDGARGSEPFGWARTTRVLEWPVVEGRLMVVLAVEGA